MSRYMIDKFMRTVEMSDEAVAQYRADPAGFVDTWLAHEVPAWRESDDRILTAAERDAFAARDYGALYALGAHPYLLWHFTEAVYIAETTWPVLKEEYRAAVTPHGSPEFIV